MGRFTRFPRRTRDQEITAAMDDKRHPFYHFRSRKRAPKRSPMRMTRRTNLLIWGSPFPICDSNRLHSSPVGINFHDQYGLWYGSPDDNSYPWYFCPSPVRLRQQRRTRYLRYRVVAAPGQIALERYVCARLLRFRCRRRVRAGGKLHHLDGSDTYLKDAALLTPAYV